MRLGKYELLCELASGGMGFVHVARQVGAAGFSRLVAIKRLHRHYLKEPHFREMVRDEARLASQIHHPNVVPVVDLIEEENELCLVLEYVPSVSLSALLRAAAAAGEKLPLSVASRILSDVLAGLHAAHEVRDIDGRPLGIVHRDVSPQNVVIGVDGSSRLIDFGVAKATVTTALTKSGEIKGKLPYMSPEQLRRERIDRRADLFAAGAVTYEVLTGSRRFDGPDEGALLLSILLGGPVDLTKRGFSIEIDAVVNKALAHADERFVDAREFQIALEHAIPPASHRDVAETVERFCGPALAERAAKIRASSRTELPQATTTDIAATTDLEPATVRVRAPVRTWAIAIAAVAVVVAVGAVAFAGRGREVAPGVAAAPVEAPSSPVDAPSPSTGPATEVAPVASVASVPSAAKTDGRPPATQTSAGRRVSRPPRAVASAELKKNPFH